MESKHVLARVPYHITARPEDVAERILVMGDPDRVREASKLLKDVKLASGRRGFPVYTGFFNGVRVSVAAHGIGGPSAAIVFEELKMLGAEVIVRLGTCGGLKREIILGSVIVPVGAAYERGGTIGMYVGNTCYPAVPDLDLTLAFERRFRMDGFRVFRGLVASSDAFHAEEEYSRRWRKLNIIGVEMECATLFTLARLRGFRAAAVLMVIDNLEDGTAMKLDEIRKFEEKALKTALKALTEIR